MTLNKLIPLVALFSLAAFGARGTDLPLQFKDIGGVKEWRADGAAIVYVKNDSNQWYKVEMYEACMTQNTQKGVQFLTERDFDTNQPVSKVVVDHHICVVTSISKVSAPSPTAKRNAQ